MRSVPPILLLSLFLAGSSSFQGSLEKREFQIAAKKIHKHAIACFKAKWYSEAKQLWRELLEHYESDHEEARSALGYKRSNGRWIEGEVAYPDKDLASPGTKRRLRKKWRKLCIELNKMHKKLSVRLRKAGDEGRADHHLDRALRYLPGDAEIASLKNLSSFEAFHGLPSEVGLLRRSRIIRQALDILQNMDFEVRRLSEESTHPVIERGLGNRELFYHGVESKHFRIWGDIRIESMITGARNAERALHFCRAVFGGYSGFSEKRAETIEFSFWRTPGAWESIVSAHTRDRRRLEFLLKYVRNAQVSGGRGRFFVSKNDDNLDLANDMVVRTVGTVFSPLKTDALKEGLGHTMAGLFFKKTLHFGLAPRRSKGTLAKRKEYKPLIPDIEKWKEMAVDLAWTETDIPANRLPLLNANHMTDEDRIKAWSFVHYLVRRDPNLLRILDATTWRGKPKGPTQVEELFERYAKGLPLGGVEEDWRKFWKEPDRLLRLVDHPWNRKSSLPDRLSGLMVALNEVRIARDLPILAWGDTVSHQWREFLDLNWAPRLLNQGRLPREPGEKLGSYLKLGSEFWLRCLNLSTKEVATGRIQAWFHLPGFRNLILDPRGQILGILPDSRVELLEVDPFRKNPGNYRAVYPERGQEGVPTQVSLESLGGEIRKKTRELKLEGRAALGYPLTIHFFDHLPAGKGKIFCRARSLSEEIHGFLHLPDRSLSSKVSALGMAVFFPFEPLPGNAEIEFTWSWKDPKTGRMESWTNRFRTGG